ncbi:MerR family transcriptional regulator [Candidatus Woesearchaeota archaeon]|nr:MerR family transcriptional regulator [Candidatus Woesearchaeota archaeon]MBW3021689.1 MerR family transcriptional regulator [Candidatus Woesearchaeota archaeon]
MKSFFTPKEICRILDVSYRTIEYWDKTNLINPSYRRRGKYRLYTFTDLVQLKIALELKRKLKYSTQRLRRVARSLKTALPQVTHPLKGLTFYLEKKDASNMLVFEEISYMSPRLAENYFRVDVKDLVSKLNEAYPEVPRADLGECRFHHTFPSQESPALVMRQQRVRTHHYDSGDDICDIMSYRASTPKL